MNTQTEWPKGFEGGKFKVVAFLQNAYFRNPNSPELKDYYRHDRKGVGKRGLFLSLSKSGKNLKKVFGDLYNVIYWTNASTVITNEARTCPKADPEYILKVLEDCKPEIIICFGAFAVKEVSKVIQENGIGGMVYAANHPSPRAFKREQVEEIARKIRGVLEAQHPGLTDHRSL